MASEDLFEDENISEQVAPSFENEIEETTEVVEAIEPVPVAETAMECDTVSPQETTKQKAEKSTDHKLLQLPLARIRNIMKLDPDLHIASNEAVFCVTRATELFIASIARESYQFTLQAGKKTIQKKDVEEAIETVDSLEFLDGSMF